MRISHAIQFKSNEYLFLCLCIQYTMQMKKKIMLLTHTKQSIEIHNNIDGVSKIKAMQISMQYQFMYMHMWLSIENDHHSIPFTKT